MIEPVIKNCPPKQSNPPWRDEGFCFDKPCKKKIPTGELCTCAVGMIVGLILGLILGINIGGIK